MMNPSYPPLSVRCIRVVCLLYTSYKSFALSENIGDITAKGEAQIAVVDLVGMILGVSISRLIRLSKWGLVLLFAGLSVLDIVFIYQEIRR